MLEVLQPSVQVADPFGLMMFNVVEMKPVYCPVQLDQLEVTTVVTVRMLESYALQVSVPVVILHFYVECLGSRSPVINFNYRVQLNIRGAQEL